jgi:N-acetylmuramoyl-L-alanine amidase
MKFVVLYNTQPVISAWAHARFDFDLRSFDFSDAPKIVRPDGDIVIDPAWLSQQVDTVKYDGVVACVEGDVLIGNWGNHKGLFLNGKRFSVLQVEVHEGIYREYTGVFGMAKMSATKKVTEYPQAEYTFDHEMIHAYKYLQGELDLLHINVRFRRYDFYKNSIPKKPVKIEEPKIIPIPPHIFNQPLTEVLYMEAPLKHLKKNIIINAGHHENDTGAVSGDIVERDECYKVRDEVVPLLEARGYKVFSVPDDLTLLQSISFANKVAPDLNDALAVDIHFNALSMGSARGSEAFHGTSQTSKEIAATLSEKISDALGIPDRGAKPDTQTAVGRLAWIRDTKMWASLVEICFITNKEDMAALRAPNGYKNVATGIADAIDELFGVETVIEPIPTPPENPLENVETIELINELKRRLETGEL